jgi:hypothetical protein
VTGDRFLAMTDNALHHIPAGMFFLLDDAPPHFSCHGHAFLDRKRGPNSLALSFSRPYAIRFFVSGVYKRHHVIEERCKM